MTKRRGLDFHVGLGPGPAARAKEGESWEAPRYCPEGCGAKLTGDWVWCHRCVDCGDLLTGPASQRWCGWCHLYVDSYLERLKKQRARALARARAGPP